MTRVVAKLPVLMLLMSASALTSAQREAAAQETKGTFLKYNPHLAIFKGKEVDFEACLLCHQVKPNTDPKMTGQKKYLNADPDDICEGCHGKRPHVGALVHRTKPKGSMLKRIKRWEEKTKRTISLDKNGKIMCVTCHNPHKNPKTLFKSLDANAYKDYKAYYSPYSEKKEHKSSLYGENIKRFERSGLYSDKKSYSVNEVTLPFRQNMKGGSFCKVCHDIYD